MGGISHMSTQQQQSHARQAPFAPSQGSPLQQRPNWMQWSPQLPRLRSSVTRPAVNQLDAGSTTGLPREQKGNGKRPYLGLKAIVVGAGPAGCVAAGFLAKQGFSVKVFEQRGDPSVVVQSMHRSFPIDMYPSTVAVLKELHVDIPPESGGYVNGLHRLTGEFHISAEGKVESQPRDHDFCLVGFRPDIVKTILQGITRQYRDIDFRFEHTCSAVSFENQTASFKDGEGNETEEDYDLLVVANGANSIIRETLATFDGDYASDSIPCDVCYKIVRPLKLPDAESALSKATLPGHVTYLWPKSKIDGKSGPMRFQYSLNELGDIHATITGLRSQFDNIKGREASWAEAALPDIFPQDWKKQTADQLIKAPLSKHPSILYSSKMTGKRTALLGDASHSIIPTLGMGCNMAVGDGSALNEALERANGDIDMALKIFNEMRYPYIQDVLNLQLSMPGVGLQQPLKRWWWRLIGMVHNSMHEFGHRWLPSLVPPSVYSRFLEQRISATTGLEELKREGWMLMGLVAGSAVLIGNVVMTAVGLSI